MRAIAHLSDLHFGRVHPATLEPLRLALWGLKPDLLAISGDFTQRARVKEFEEARSFLDTLPAPWIVVPGNHDVPLYNPLLRFTAPLARYQRYITDDLSPMYVDSEIAVLGVNTTRALVTKGGRVNRRQVTEICRHFDGLIGKSVKVVVTHHPFDLPEGHSKGDLVGRSRMAMEAFARCGVDLFLGGHQHLTHQGTTARYAIEGYSALVIQAGTATSTRGRGEPNSFNLIRIAPLELSVETHTWQPDREVFDVSEVHSFRRTEQGWFP